MLDQSFSPENLRKILDYENRKGLYLEKIFFPEVEKINKKIKHQNIQLKKGKGELNKTEYEGICKIRDELKGQKETKLQEELKKVSEKIISKDYKIELKKVEIEASKALYTVKKEPEIYFSFKQVQYNISKLYKVKQANRFAIVDQIKALLNDTFPKYVLRIDIENFYESIPHKKLIQKINEDNLLTFLSKKIIRQILKDYEIKSGNNKGVPRGVGISAYLCELYMRTIDSRIKAISTVTYYARYVDDIIIIFTPQNSNDREDYEMKVKEIVEDQTGLNLNKDKTYVVDLRRSNSRSCLEYLGYKFFFGESGKGLCVRLTDKKIDKYKKRITLLLEAYNTENIYNKKAARRLLINRVKFLTGNTRLLNNKNNVLIGIYFTHSLLTSFEDLEFLDQEFYNKIDALISCNKLKERLKQFSFKNGFEKRRFTKFNSKEMSDILKIWKKLVG